MTSLRILRGTINAAKTISARMASSSQSAHAGQYSRNPEVDLTDFDPNNYNVPIRTATMDDMMEPYGPWKTAYEAEKSLANRTLIKGIICLAASLIFMFNSGALEGLDMPNLDNIMEETEPLNFDTEGRVSVTRDDD